MTVGYLIFGPPSNLLVARLRPSIYLPCLMVVWGTCTCCMAAVKTYPQLLVLRILTGIAEAGFTPGLYFLLSCWYVPKEQGKRGAVVFSAALVGGAFGGIVAGTVTGGLEGAHGIRGWRWLFIIEGVVTIGSAILASFILPDFPSTCRRFTVREKEIANARLTLVGTATQQYSGMPPLGKVESITLAVKDWRTWAMTGMLGV
jgi:MFS family permease